MSAAVAELPSRMLSAGKVAELFDVTAETVKEWSALGRFPKAVRVGRRWFWAESTVAQFFASNGTAATPGN